jgi:hypothetical protein
VALNNGTAVANKDLQAGNGTVISLADGNNTLKYDSTQPREDPAAASPEPAATSAAVMEPANATASPAPELESPAPDAASPAPAEDAPTTDRVARTWEAAPTCAASPNATNSVQVSCPQVKETLQAQQHCSCTGVCSQEVCLLSLLCPCRSCQQASVQTQVSVPPNSHRPSCLPVVSSILDLACIGMLPGKQQVSLNWLSLLLLVPPPAPLTLQDFNGRLWGQNEDETSCAYKTADKSPIYYADYKRITWQDSPVCRGYNQTTDSAQPDAEGRLWGYQNGANCVFIHPDGTPVKDVNELLPKDQVEVSRQGCSKA